jgi:ATP adenylyltransferase
MEYILGHKDGGCLFCEKVGEDKDRENLILLRTPLSFVMMNLYPYNNGHLMVAPIRHAATFKDLEKDERCDLMDAISTTQGILERALSPEGMNAGVNIGRCAGAGVLDHLHVHVVPRWSGDTNFMPVISDARVMPEALRATYERLVAEIDGG